MNGLETPRCEFKVTVAVRWFLDVEQTGELLRAMAAVAVDVFFTSEEFNRVVDWIAREKSRDDAIALNAMSAVGGGGVAPIEPRKPELISADFNKRLVVALQPPAPTEDEEKVRKLLRQIFTQSAKAVDKMQTP